MSEAEPRDIAKVLREIAAIKDRQWGFSASADCLREAADEIERLRAIANRVECTL